MLKNGIKVINKKGLHYIVEVWRNSGIWIWYDAFKHGKHPESAEPGA